MKLLISLLLPLGLWAQCSVNAPVLHNTGDVSTILDNRTKGCNAFALTWAAQTGVTALSIALEGSDDNSTYTAFPSAAVAVGVNPGVTLSGALVVQASTTTAYLRVHAITVTGTGSVLFQLYGFSGVQPSAKAGGGGGGGGGIVTQSWTAGGSIAPGALVCPSSGVIPVAAITCPLTVVGINPLMINRAIIGIAQNAATIGNAVSVIVQGPATCAFDGVNAPTAGHLATYSLGTAGECQDSGTGGATIGVPIAGVVVTTGAINTTQQIYMFGSGNFGSGLATVAPLHLNNPATGNQFAIQLGNITGGQVGSGTKFLSATGTFTSGDCLKVDPVTGSIADAGAACGSGSGITSVFGNSGPVVGATGDIGATGTVVAVNGAAVPVASSILGSNPSGQLVHGNPLFSDIQGISTNTLATMTVGTGATLNRSGSGVIDANKLLSVSFCTGFTPTTGQNLQYTTALSPNPCYTAAAAGGTGGGGIVVYSGSTVAYTGTMYFAVGGGAAVSVTEASVQTASPSAATISNLRVQLSAALGVGNSAVFTWRDGGASQTLTCTISGASATSCSDTTHSFNVASGDLIDIQVVVTGTVVVTPTTVISTAFGTSGVGVTSVFGNSGPAVGATGDIGATGKVLGVNGVSLCTGFTPTTGQNLQYTTASSPNPCYTAAAGGGGGTTIWTGAGSPNTAIQFAPTTMTGNTTPSPYVALASSTLSGYSPYCAFALSTPCPGNNPWYTNLTATGFLQIYIGIGYSIASYAVMSTYFSDATRAPKDWTLRGSFDGVTWVVLDTQTNQTSWASPQTRTFSLSAISAAYLYYQLNVTANNGSSLLGIQQLFLYMPPFASGVAGDFYASATPAAFYGPRPAGAGPTWPLVSLQAGGATFTAAGCANSTLVGGATAGSYHSGTSGTCTVTITMGSNVLAPNGWACQANDLTTPANVQFQTGTTSQTATISGTTGSGDVINFSCIGY